MTPDAVSLGRFGKMREEAFYSPFVRYDHGLQLGDKLTST
jgi:hypothetical protein